MTFNERLTEKQIENDILRYLKLTGYFVFKIKSVGTFDPKLGRFRRSSPMYMKGVSDILGILPDGRFLAIEVKSEKGRVSPVQAIFIDEIISRGGVAFVARSLSDVQAEFTKRGINDGNMVTAKPRQAASS